VVNRRPLAVEDWVLSRVNTFGIHGGKSGTGTEFSLSYLVFLCQYYSKLASHTYISPGGLTESLLAGAVQRRNLPIDMNKRGKFFLVLIPNSRK
jgi:hypothetical protein